MRLRDAVRKYLNVVQENGDEWTINCPDPEHVDRRPSASVNVAKGVYVCYSCGSGGKIVDLLEGVRLTEDPETQDLLDELELDLTFLDQETIHHLPEAWLDQFDVNHLYWTDRGFTDWAKREFRLGYDWEWDTPTYPIRDPQGRVLGVIRRRLHDGQLDPYGREMPKYTYPKHVDVSECLFGYERVRDQSLEALVVTEGALDAIAFWEAGIPAVGQWGIMLREPQIRLLRRLAPRSLVLAYDMDLEGLKSRGRTLKGYKDDKGRQHPPLDLDFTTVQVASWDPAWGKDPCDLTIERRHSAFDLRWDPELG